MPGQTVEATPEAPRRRGRKPAVAVTKRRHDPKDSPLDGYTRPDLIINQRKGFKYAMLTPDDSEVKTEQGYRRVERTASGPRPKWWSGDSAVPGYRRKGLTLYEIREDRHSQLHSFHLGEAARRMADVNNDSRRSPDNSSRVETR